MDYSHYERIKIDRRDHILTLTLNRPESRNAVDGRMHNELATIFYDVQLDEQADVIVITGAGSAFSAGGDINWLASLRQAGSAGQLAAVDVKNPLLGNNGATRVFGPQKGVTPDRIDKFERALMRLADVVAEQFGVDYRNEPGAGAAGGLGFGLMSFCGAKIRPGFDVVAESVGLESKMKDVDLVITGEGSLDRQTLEGKTPAGVAQLARKLGKRIFAMVGRASDDAEVQKLFEGVFQNARSGMSQEENMKRAAELLRENARELARTVAAVCDRRSSMRRS